MKKKTKILFIVLAVLVIVIAAVITTVVVTTRGSAWRIKALAGNETTQNKTHEYKKSYLYLYKNNTFEIAVIYLDQTQFLAVGTFKKEKNKYTFTYVDAWMYTENNIVERDPYPHDNYIGESKDYSKKKGRLEFIDHLGIYYYFG